MSRRPCWRRPAPGAWALDGDNSGLRAGDILIRGRAIGVLPDTSSTVQPVGGHVELGNTVMPEIDASYFVTDNIAFEVIAATTHHSASDHASSSGNLDLGSVWLLPPILTAQWHFLPQADFNPYLGAGINYTIFYGEHAGNSINSIRYDNHVGWALQAGFDYNMGQNWFANVDLKKLFVSTTAHINNNAVAANVDIDPWIIGAGIGYRFEPAETRRKTVDIDVPGRRRRPGTPAGVEWPGFCHGPQREPVRTCGARVTFARFIRMWGRDK